MKLFLMFVLLSCTVFAQAAHSATISGFVLHFDHFSSSEEAMSLIDKGIDAGAQAFNIVPPAHVWESARDLKTLDLIVQALEQKHIPYVFARIDAMYLPVPGRDRTGWLYSHLLKEPGCLPNGTLSDDWFRATVNVPGYVEWMERETAFYAKRYGRNPQIWGFTVGLFSEPFVSQRGSLFSFSSDTNSYEIDQYTRHTQIWWHNWLQKRWKRLHELNAAYGTHFSNINVIPMPINEHDRRFQSPDAYADFIRCLNDWVMMAQQRCQKQWHTVVGLQGPSFILQMSGDDAEKFNLGRPAMRYLNWREWARNADAIGISIYTNSGYADNGHKSIIETIDNIIQIAGTKTVFVMESGAEEPKPILDFEQWRFISAQARRLRPKVFFYEFLKVPYYDSMGPNDGHLVLPDGQMNEQVKKALPILWGERSAQ